MTSIIFFSSTDTSVVRTSVPVIAKPAQTIMAIDFVVFTDPDVAPDSPAVRHANGMQASQLVTMIVRSPFHMDTFPRLLIHMHFGLRHLQWSCANLNNSTCVAAQ